MSEVKTKRLHVAGSFGGPGVSSWNDLTDKPFGEESTGAVIECDGNTDLSNTDTVEINGHTFYKISNHIPTIDDLADGEFSGDIGEGMVTVPSEMVAMLFDVSPFDSNLIWGGDGFAVFRETTVQAYRDESITVPSTGVYVCPDQFFPFRISYGSTTIKTIDEKFIPEVIARVSDIPQGGSGGLSLAAAALLIDILRSATYTENVTGKIAALEVALVNGDSGGSTPDIPDAPDEPVADEIIVSDGAMTIVTVGSAITVSDGIMTIA